MLHISVVNVFFEFVTFECKLLIISLILPSETLSVHIRASRQYENASLYSIINVRLLPNKTQITDLESGSWLRVITLSCLFTLKRFLFVMKNHCNDFMWLSVIPHVSHNAKRYKYLINCGRRMKASSPNLVFSPASPRSAYPRRMGVLERSLVVCRSFSLACIALLPRPLSPLN